MRSRTVKRLAIVVLAVLLTAGAAVVYLLSANLVWLKDPVERAASRSLGRELRIYGAFSLRIGKVSRLSAREVVLANAPWGYAPALARIARIEVALDTASLLRGPIHVRSLALDGIAIDLERNGRGESNWAPAPKKAPVPSGKRQPLPRLDRLNVTDLRLAYRDPARIRPLAVVLSKVDIRQDAAGLLHLAVEGAVDGRRFELLGGGGPLKNLLAGKSVAQDLRFRLGRISGRLAGRTRSLSSLAGASLDLFVEGPDLGELARLLNAPDLGSGPFRVRASARPGRPGRRIAVTASAHAATFDASLHGSVEPGEPPALDLAVQASGANARPLGLLAGLGALPARPFSCSGTLRARGFPLELGHVDVRLGRAVLRADGSLGRPPAMNGTSLSLNLSAPDGGLMVQLAHVALPPGAVAVRGKVAIAAGAVTIRDLRARVGGNTLAADGVIATSKTYAGSTFTVRAAGPDLAALDGLAGTHLPGGPFAVDARLTMVRSGFRVDRLKGRLWADRVTAAGRVVTADGLAGTALDLSVAGKDPAALASLIGLPGLPPGPFRARARLEIEPGRIHVSGIDAALGSGTFTGAVDVASPPGAGPVEVAFEGTGRNAAELAALTGLEHLPAAPYRASVRLAVTRGAVQFTDLEAVLGSESVTLRGRLTTGTGLVGSSLEITASGKDVSRLGRILGFPALPPVPFSLAGGVDIVADGYRLRRLAGTIAANRILVDGTVAPERRSRLALDVNLKGSDVGSLRAVLAGLGVPGIPTDLPPGPYSCAGHIEHGPAGLAFRAVRLSLAGLSGSVEGAVGAAPSFRGTDLRVSAKGAGTVQLPGPRGRPVILSGFAAAGRVRLRHGKAGAPEPVLGISGSLTTRRLELGARPGAAREAAKPASELVVPDEPLELDFLKVFDGTIRCRIGELILPSARLKGLVVGVHLAGGALRLDPIEGVPGHGGTIRGTLSIEPAGTGYRAALSAAIEKTPVDLSRGTSGVETWPALNSRIELVGSGRSLHQIMSTAGGRFSATIGGGRIASGALEVVGGSALMQILDIINPFAKNEPSTRLDCAVVAGRIAGGVVTLDPLGLKTANVTTTGRGTLYLATEKLDVVITAKPRRGLGLSASSLTNSLLKVGGTLRRPVPRVRPLTGAANTGVAVATAGLSLLARGLWNRVTSGADICAAMRRKVDTLWRNPPARASAPSSSHGPSTAPTGSPVPRRGRHSLRPQPR